MISWTLPVVVTWAMAVVALASASRKTPRMRNPIPLPYPPCTDTQPRPDLSEPLGLSGDSSGRIAGKWGRKPMHDGKDCMRDTRVVRQFSRRDTQNQGGNPSNWGTDVNTMKLS